MGEETIRGEMSKRTPQGDDYEKERKLRNTVL